MGDNHILITGCSGGGKSTLLRALHAKGYKTIEEPGRRIVKQELSDEGSALPWLNLSAFAKKAIAMAQKDLKSVQPTGALVFFDRGLVDAALALDHSGGAPFHQTLGINRHYAKTVFFTPPWPEIFEQDDERKHSFDHACFESECLRTALQQLGYEICDLPKRPVEDRLTFLLKRHALTKPTSC